MILIHYLVRDPARIEFCYPGREKPYLDSTSGGEGPRFKMSRSPDLAPFAFAYDREVGVDLEYIDPVQNIELIATRNFSADERVEFQKLQDKQKVKSVCACWTRKEAYLKAVGNGLTHASEKIEVSSATDEPAQLSETIVSLGNAVKRLLEDLSPAPGFAAALAAEGYDWHPSCWEYSLSLDPAIIH